MAKRILLIVIALVVFGGGLFYFLKLSREDTKSVSELECSEKNDLFLNAEIAYQYLNGLDRPQNGGKAIDCYLLVARTPVSSGSGTVKRDPYRVKKIAYQILGSHIARGVAGFPPGWAWEWYDRDPSQLGISEIYENRGPPKNKPYPIQSASSDQYACIFIPETVLLEEESLHLLAQQSLNCIAQGFEQRKIDELVGKMALKNPMIYYFKGGHHLFQVQSPILQKEGIEILMDGAEKNNVASLYLLGLANILGIGTEKNLEKALAYLKRTNGQFGTPYILASFYFNGLAGRRDPEQALYWLEWGALWHAAIAQGVLPQYQNIDKEPRDGHPNKLFFLAMAYHKGYGTNPDLQEAMKLYEKAHQKGHRISTYMLGFLNAGKEVRDFKKAKGYFTQVLQDEETISAGLWGSAPLTVVKRLEFLQKF